MTPLRRLLVLVPLLVPPSFAAPRGPQTAQATGAPPVRHLVLLERGPSWPPSPAAPPLTVLEEHRRYMVGLFAQGDILVGGPAVDRSCGIVVFDIAERAEVERIVAADPAVVAGVFVAEIRPFRGLSAAEAAPRPELPPTPIGLAPLRLEALIAAPLSEVWRAWSTAEGAETFFAPEVTLELEPLGTLEVLWFPEAPAGQRGAEGLRVLAYVPERMLAFEWNAPPQFARARPERTFVVVELEPLAAAKTRVVLLHQGFAEQAQRAPDAAGEWQEVRAYFEGAWRSVLDSLEQRFASGPVDWQARAAAPAK